LGSFENRVLRRIYGAKREEQVAGGWRRLHSEELHNLYASLNIIKVINSRRMRLVRNVARVAAMRNGYKILVGTSERKSPLRRPRRRWEDNITVDLREIGWDVVNTVTNLRVP